MQKMQTMRNPIKKSVTAVMLTAIFLAICILTVSCDGDNKRVAFSPRSGSYEIMLDGSEWAHSDGETVWDLWIHRTTAPMMLVQIDYFPKENMIPLGVSDFYSFIRYYRTQGIIMELYEFEYGEVRELEVMDMSSRYLRGSDVIAGKRQQIFISLPPEENHPGRDSVTELVFLETEGHFFAIRYNAEIRDIDRAMSLVNDMVQNLRMLRYEDV